MRTASAAYAERVTRGAATRIEVTSWLGTRRLGTVPVVTGSWSVEDADDQAVPGRIAFDVPATREWIPSGPTHPLAGMGQQFVVRAGIDVGDQIEWLPLGRFRAEAPSLTGDTLSVSGFGLLAVVERARLLAPWRSARGATRTQVLGRLLGGLIPWRSIGLTDEVMAPITIDRERLEGVREIVDAWPARMAVSDSGVLEIRPPWNDTSPGSPVVEILDGPSGTLRSVTAQPDRSAMFNGYSVSTVPEGDAQPVTESWVQPSGPLAWGGPYGQFPGFFASPALPPNRVRLREVAKTLTLRAARRRDAYEVEAAPDARVQVGDVARVRSARAQIDIVGRVTQVAHSRTALRCTVAYLSGDRP